MINMQIGHGIPLESFKAIVFSVVRSSLDLAVTSFETTSCEGPSEWTLIDTTALSARRYRVAFPLTLSLKGSAIIEAESRTAEH